MESGSIKKNIFEVPFESVISRKKITTSKVRKMKSRTKIVSATAYDHYTAKIIDEAGVDVILVGDSLGMVMLGYPNTTHVTLGDMLHHTKAVSRSNPKALLVSDLPFLTYGIDVKDTIKNAGILVQEGAAEAVKLEGGVRIFEHVKALVDREIPVMGHIGLTPQSIHSFGGYKVQGKTKVVADKIREDAVSLQEAGVFSIVIEGVPSELGAQITEEIEVPTIGIGAGPFCDGQILVTQDMLGLFSDFTPKFVKVYSDLGTKGMNAVETFCNEVRSGDFPTEEHSF